MRGRADLAARHGTLLRMSSSSFQERAAAVLMVQGCASGVGKSWLVAGLCRLYRRRGLSVAPFKAQNLSLNAAVTEDGGEIGRSTAVQARAAGVEPTVDMNPFLVKPESGGAPQLVVLGRAASRAEAARLLSDRDERARVALDALARLRAEHDLVVIEGAGSPAEPNLRERDAVNMHVARAVDAPVLLVGDISRGGVFAHLSGTLDWLPAEDRALVRGLVINRLHGDPALLGDAVRALEERAGVPVVGVVPALDDVALPDEDAAHLDDRAAPAASAAKGDLDVAVVRLPHLSNHDDWQPLERESGVAVRYITDAASVADADLVVLPGTKDTRADLLWLARTGIALAVQERAAAGDAVLGVCGGYQMLGRWVLDPVGVEGAPGMIEGLGLLPCETRFSPEKTTRRRRVRVADLADDAPFRAVGATQVLDGYEIRNGAVHPDVDATPWFRDPEDGSPEGLRAGRVFGTALHGLFANAAARRALLAHFGRDPGPLRPDGHDADYDRLADALEEHLDTARVDGWIGP